MTKSGARAGSVSAPRGLMCALIAVAGMAAAAQGEVRFRDGSVLDGPAQLRQNKAQVVRQAEAAGQTHVLLRFDGPVSLDDRARLAADGVTLLDYAGGYAYFATVDPAPAGARGATLDRVLSVH